MSWSLDEKGFKLNEPQLYRPWYNYLSNPDYGIKISHLGDAFSTTIQEPRVSVTNYDFFAPTKGRFIYIKDGDTVWSPSYYPARTELDTYECTHAPGYTGYKSSKDGVECDQVVFLPAKGAFEIWKVKVKNNSKETKKISLFTEVELLLYPSFNIDPVYFSWFTNSEYKADTNTLVFKKLVDSAAATGFFTAIEKPTAYDASRKVLLGNGDIQLPEGIKKGKLSNSNSAGDPYVGAYQYDIELAPGEEKGLAFFLGIGDDVHDSIKNYFTSYDVVEKEFDFVVDHWKKKNEKEEFEAVEDGIFKSYLKTFFPYMIHQQSEGLVRSTFRGYRDVGQDAMGLVYFNPEGAKDIILTMCTKMFTSGRCLRQWNTSGGFNDERDFRDLPLWLVLAVDKYIEVTGDASILDEMQPFFDDEAKASVYDHMIAGCEYILKIGEHGLVEMGIGDWNDALSGLGETGGSVWLNEIAYHALEIIKSINEKYGKSCSINIEENQEILYQGVLKYWNGKWFGRGVTDKGELVGGPERIFLLPQAWFVISGMNKRDPEKAKIAMDNMIKELNNPHGYLVCSPGFDEPDATVGNLSALAPGLAENFAVYNHASMFAAYSLFKYDYIDEAVELLKKVMPMYKDYKVTMAEPYVLVNYYNGGYYDYKAGEGGIPWLTGTVNWLAMAVFEDILPKGIKIS